ncbi:MULTISPECIES: DUF4230 domain-containing protein [Aerococcus]|uniref:DUF4230 domain-containing protein n=1 Tax=Aerococcus tenax TaxID=3078812 RepID=A0A5N1BQ15_9LACT|nr:MULTISPECIES: DUF4230 domain-containing protein [Aerococcus]AEA00498.1 hypothetical protein HMPREF9243_0684 [Aerococcus sp. Group 1]KAA9240651.1 DUF4230 domain-containing protein [Aerococcus urinae]MCY3031084.1 DUF4230 domain-containing protein [Aerococcus sp. Group 1]MCY3054176.1 DUF4230 domain-containing protein [Aerococcus sp. Group 1]MCY3055906.1 DUF4230 domain-containing protein [Aerococcus sp. Group 1]
MRRFKKFLGVLVIILGLLAVAFIGGHYLGKQDSQTEITSELVGNRLEQAKELTTTKYFYTNTASFENQRKFYNWNLPFTTKKFIVSYDGVIHVGIDLSAIDVKVQDQTIDVTLPEVKILSHDIDSDSVKVFDEEASIFNKMTVDDYANFTNEQKKASEEEAKDKGLLEAAKQNTERTIKEILNMDPTIQENYTINVH